MESCIHPDHPCLITKHTNPGRKLPYSLEAIKGSRSWIGVNTQNANLIARRFLDCHFENIRSEVTMGPGWRTDFMATCPELKRDVLIEVKNVSLSKGDVAAFPDSVTKRGQAHLEKILTRLTQGELCGLLFVVQRNDVNSFHPAHWVDPMFDSLFWKCLEAGLWLWIQKIRIDTRGFHDAGCLPLLSSFTP